jgi:membrane associated rhomboid family serine protease
MIIPIRTDYRRRHTPWVNYLIIAANLVLYFAGHNASTPQARMAIDTWMLQPEAPELHQFFSCMFLHADVWHLLGNMVFLWVFGSAVNDKFGHAGYAAFYLGGGVLAGVGYLLLAGRAPVLGASGAIAAVAGAYLVLLPATNITLIVWLLYFIMPIEVSSLYFIFFQFLFDSFMTLYGSTGLPGSGGVAYAAHATGYAWGILVAGGLLVFGLLPRDDFDMLHLIKARHRRARYRRMAAAGYDPFSRTPPENVRKQVQVQSVDSEPAETASAAEIDLRKRIAQATEQHDTPTMAKLYLDLCDIAEEPVLARQAQLDVANQLMADEQYAGAALAYERFIQHYPNYQYLPDIHLMLGLIYSRYLHQYPRATERLERAAERLSEPAKQSLARDELARVQQRLKS